MEIVPKPKLMPPPANGFKKGQSGYAPGTKGYRPGRPKLTELQRAIKKGLKEVAEQYRQYIIAQLPEIGEALIAKAKAGDVNAIKEVHSVIGLHDKQIYNLIPMQINITSDREKYLCDTEAS